MAIKTIRQKALLILTVCGVPIEPNNYTDEVIRRVMAIIDKRTK